MFLFSQTLLTVADWTRCYSQNKGKSKKLQKLRCIWKLQKQKAALHALTHSPHLVTHFTSSITLYTCTILAGHTAVMTQIQLATHSHKHTKKRYRRGYTGQRQEDKLTAMMTWVAKSQSPCSTHSTQGREGEQCLSTCCQRLQHHPQLTSMAELALRDYPLRHCRVAKILMRQVVTHGSVKLMLHNWEF